MSNGDSPTSELVRLLRGRPARSIRFRTAPGLPRFSIASATYGVFLQRLLDQITPPHPGRTESGRQPLAALTTRAPDDPAIALLDAWAVVADVLTFYQERIANEGYLRTATERRSVLELARAIGYELSPGVAASVYCNSP